MKRHSILTLLLVVATGMMAAPRSLQEAQQEAVQYFNTHSHDLRKPAKSQTLTHTWTSQQTDGQPAFYVFNRGEEDGWVMISAEDRTRSVIAYSESGHFDVKKMPDNMRAWINRYTRTIEHVAATASSQPAVARHIPKHKVAHSAQAESKTYTPVSPICKTQWNQMVPYNNLCPRDADSELSVTGCVATAAAQVMKAHNYPEKGIGSHTYMWYNSAGDSAELSADFGNTYYDWGNMLDNYEAVYSTAEQQYAVAELMYHCGVASNMEYTSEESATGSIYMICGMIDHFGYDPGVRHIMLDYMNEEAFVDSLAADFAMGNPVFFSARTIANEGHAFVGDGIDKDGLIHINWGWGGAGDAYFSVSLMDPENQGTGGSSGDYAFTENVEAFIHIQPNQNGKALTTITCDNLQYTTKAGIQDAIWFKVANMANGGVRTWEGLPAWIIYQNGKPYRTLSYYEYYQSWAELDPGYYFYEVEIPALMDSLPVGRYEASPAVIVKGTDEVYPMLVKGFGEIRLALTITSDSVFMGLAPDTVAPQDPDTTEVIHPEYDSEEWDFAEEFDSYRLNESLLAQYRLIQLEAAQVDQEGDSAYITLLINVPTTQGLTPGAYAVDTTWEDMTIYSGYFDEGIAGSFAGYKNKDNLFYTPVWYLVDGTVTVKKDGTIVVDALNSYGKTIQCLIHKDTEAVDEVTAETEVRKILRNGQILIRRNGEIYTIRGIKVRD